MVKNVGLCLYISFYENVQMKQSLTFSHLAKVIVSLPPKRGNIRILNLLLNSRPLIICHNVTMAELAACSPHDRKVVSSNPVGSKSDLTKLSHIVCFNT